MVYCGFAARAIPDGVLCSKASLRNSRVFHLRQCDGLIFNLWFIVSANHSSCDDTGTSVGELPPFRSPKLLNRNGAMETGSQLDRSFTMTLIQLSQ